ncbi:MAG: hypothetical protein MI976_24400 [Pseudomonadales bacterium]|nr:hypothetical protein [Pseudomonadales bacterium]
MKFLGILFAILAALFLLWMGAGFVWWQSNHEEVKKAMSQAVEEGEAIGRDSTDAECLDTYLAIINDCKEMTCSIQNQVFLKTCLENSQYTHSFCQAVPSKESLMTFAKWAAQTCLDRNIENPNCAAGLQEVSIYCKAKSS